MASKKQQNKEVFFALSFLIIAMIVVSFVSFSGLVNMSATLTYPINVNPTISGGVVISTITGLSDTQNDINCSQAKQQCSALFSAGQVVTLTASPEIGFSFDKWIYSPGNGCTTVNSNKCYIAVDGYKNIQATFKHDDSTVIVVSTIGTGSGKITGSDSNINCGTSCSVSFPGGTINPSPYYFTATANTGSTFVGWAICSNCNYIEALTPSNPIISISNLTNLSKETYQLIAEFRSTISPCTDTCTTNVCNTAKTGYFTCGNFDSDPCKELSSIATGCGSGKICSNGSCVTTPCTDTCTTNVCNTAKTGYFTCGNFDSDPCKELSSIATGCGSGKICSNGSCVTASCINDCSSEGTRKCSSYNKTYYQICGKYDADPCLEWSGNKSCVLSNACGYSMGSATGRVVSPTIAPACKSCQRPSWYCTGAGICAYSCVNSRTCPPCR